MNNITGESPREVLNTACRRMGVEVANAVSHEDEHGSLVIMAAW